MVGMVINNQFVQNPSASVWLHHLIDYKFNVVSYGVRGLSTSTDG